MDMAKKLISVWLSLTILLLSSVTIYAEDITTAEEDYVHGYFFIRNININGQLIANYELEDPLFIYQGATYVPLSGEMEGLLGFEAEVEQESRTLTITRTDLKETEITDTLKSNVEDVDPLIAADWKVILRELAAPTPLETLLEPVKVNLGNSNLAALLEEIIESRELAYDSKEADMTDLPLLDLNGMLYLPLKTLMGEEGFNLDLFYSEYYGLCISTDPGVKALCYYDADTALYNTGLTNYILKKNGVMGIAEAQEMAFLFLHEADVFNVDVLLLMAIAQKESSFNANAVSSGGALGVMQIMPATGKANGYTEEMLLNPHLNIQFGAGYISSHIDNYDGDTVIALSAYNQGSGAVNRGSYNTRYATRVTDARADIREYLTGNGYL